MSYLPYVKVSGISTRSLIWVMLFTCTFVLYMIRINLSIMILAMVGDETSEVAVPECAAHNAHNVSNMTDAHTSKLKDYGVRYDWDTKLQGLILGSYFWGFVISGMPGGGLAETFGPTKLATFSFTLSGILTVLGPLAASWSPYALIVSRFLIGLLGGVVFPCCHCLVSRWAPPDEKGKFIGALLGGSLGTVVTWPMLGAVIETIGWVWGFYVSGIIVLAWIVVWWLLVADSPDCHPRISDEEKSYIMNSLAGSITQQKEKKIPPYKDIFLSIPAWSLFVLHFGNLWGLFFLMTAGPNFMSTVLGFNLGHTGILAALPYLARMLSGFAFGAIGDYILRKNLMRKTTIRKFFVLFSHVIPGVFLIIQTFTGCHVNWAIVLVTLSLGFNGASTLTNLTNSQDLAPNFAGTLYGIANCLGSTTGFISPLIVGYMTSQHNGLDEWHNIFYIGASVYIGCGLIFCFTGTADIQPWNNKHIEKDVNGIENIAFDSTNDVKS